MPLHLNSPGWKIRGVRAARGVARDGIADLPGLPSEFLTDESSVAEESGELEISDEPREDI